MVEVTKSNFSFLLPIIEKSIDNSTFIAIDTEFTGLGLGTSNENNIFDSVPERYEKLRCRATSFIPCQIGLSLFTRELDTNSYSVETYVFYTRPCMVGSIDKRFTCQASSLDFLCGYNFNFLKFLWEGIPFINENEEKQVYRELKDGTISIPHEKLQDPRNQVKVNVLIQKKFGKYTKYHREISNEELVLPISKKCHVYFQLREIRRKFPKCWAYHRDDAIVVKMVSSKTRKQLVESEKKDLERVLDDFLGFTKVFRLLKNCQKPIVGHNLLMDLMFFYENFHQHLPDSYDEFKKELHSIFPVIYDTKHIWLNINKVNEFRSASYSSLTALYELFKSPPDYLNVLFSPSIQPSNCKQYVDEDFVHDSGYDAFMTGFIFLKICHILTMGKTSRLLFKEKPAFKYYLCAVSPFTNKVNFAYMKIKHINLEGADPPAEEINYLYISPKGWTKTVTIEELKTCFSKYPLSEFQFVKMGRSAKVGIPYYHVSLKILKDFEDNPDIRVERYNALRHSPYVSATLWLTAVTSSCLLAVWLWKSD